MSAGRAGANDFVTVLLAGLVDCLAITFCAASSGMINCNGGDCRFASDFNFALRFDLSSGPPIWLWTGHGAVEHHASATGLQ